MSHIQLNDTTWEGRPALQLCSEELQGLLLPEDGGHLLSLTHRPTGAQLLRVPKNLEAYRLLPEGYGVPVLFPPNRIPDGRFSANGVQYQLPVNDTKNQAHLHGFLYTRPWQVLDRQVGGDAVSVTLGFHSQPGGEIFSYFPHPFSARLTYTLAGSALRQEIAFVNEGETPMPFMLAFHTSFALPGHPDCREEDCTVYIGVGQAVATGARGMPTGQLLPLSADEKEYLAGRVVAPGVRATGHYTRAPFGYEGREFDGAVIENHKLGLRLTYTPDARFPYWVLWNDDAHSQFVCIEPQTCMINAANLHHERQENGFLLLAPGARWAAASTLAVDQLAR